MVVVLGGTSHAAMFAVQSPDGCLEVTIWMGAAQDDHRSIQYAVKFQGAPVLVPSAIRLDVAGWPTTPVWGVRSHQVRETNGTWRPVCGERSTIRDHYRELRLELEETATRSRLDLTVRAYDAGAALCYTVYPPVGRQETPAVHIRGEHTEFRLPADWSGWVTYSGQGVYSKVPVSKVRRGCERPLVLETFDEPPRYVALAEARLVDFARMKFGPLLNATGVVSVLDGPVVHRGPISSPWRVIMVAESPGRLLENNDIFLNLNDPCALPDVSWVRPGKVIREVTLTTEGGKACVEFAVRRGLQFIEYDAGWYGDEYDDTSDATTVTLDPKRSKGPLDLPEVIRYAREHNVGVILYVNRRALERQLDELLPLYRQWGVAGMKFGFVQVGSQQWTTWLHDAIRKCSEQRLMVDVHDEYRETGVRRTYPNLMTVEGVAGDETSPSNRTTLTYAFTRYLSGPADHTVCYYDKRVTNLACHAYQLAKPVVLYSPWQFLFWYDRPSDSQDEPELEFWNHMPTIWDDTRVLAGAIGEYAVIARRSGADWYIGAMNADCPHSFEFPLDFLDPQRSYMAYIYRHDPTVPTRTRVGIERRPVRSGDRLRIQLGPREGQAIRIEAFSGSTRPALSTLP
jgi:alpha-glucosidase